MSWPRGGRDSRFPAKVQPGTIFYDEPLNDGHPAGQIDRYTSIYEETTYVGTKRLGHWDAVSARSLPRNASSRG